MKHPAVGDLRYLELIDALREHEVEVRHVELSGLGKHVDAVLLLSQQIAHLCQTVAAVRLDKTTWRWWVSSPVSDKQVCEGRGHRRVSNNVPLVSYLRGVRDLPRLFVLTAYG